MPELPEVETTVRGLNRRVKGRRIIGVWTDWPKYFKLHKNRDSFSRLIVGRKIIKSTRRGKNILVDLSGGYILLVHQKMSGHLLYGNWKENKRPSKAPAGWESQKWFPDPPQGKLIDPKNRFIRLIFFLDNGKILALSDLRRFAKVLAGPKEKILALPDIADLGPEPLETSFSEFRKLFKAKRGGIKQILLDQKFIVGIGNIYADEILYASRIHPLSRAEKLKTPQLKALYQATRKILKKALESRGTSIDDFRDTAGAKGDYGSKLVVYQQTGKKCPDGKHTVKRIKIGGRSTHFCPVEQKLYK